MTRITKKDIEGMVVRLTRSIAAFYPRGLVEIRYERNPAYDICNLDLEVNHNKQRITIKSSKKADIYDQIHFACELFEFYGQIKDQKTPREEALQETAQYEQIAKDRMIETFEWVNVLEMLDMDEREELMNLYAKIGQHPNMLKTYCKRLDLISITFNTFFETKQLFLVEKTSISDFLIKQDFDLNKFRSEQNEPDSCGKVWLVLNDNVIVPADFDTVILKDNDVLKIVPKSSGGHSYAG